jgi:hypothetical protein
MGTLQQSATIALTTIVMTTIALTKIALDDDCPDKVAWRRVGKVAPK